MSRAFPIAIPHGQPQKYGSAEAVLMHAAEHARNRLLHSCEAISWVGGLALSGSNKRVPQFTITGAGEQAAHVLVGQLLIDGKPPWIFVADERAKVAWLARFMVTSPVPVPFNTADSAAERAGLKEAFRQACESAWSAASTSKLLTPVYAMFLEAADQAFQKAELGKQGKRASAASVAASDERFIEGLILRAYRLHGVTAAEANKRFPLPSS